MNTEFIWSPKPTPETQSTVERKISELLDDRNIKPCHANTISVGLGISGALDITLQGSAKCECGKILMTFNGDNRASHLKFSEYK